MKATLYLGAIMNLNPYLPHPLFSFPSQVSKSKELK
jgi:hypothetical protein